MEDASLKEITREFLNCLDGRKLAAGSVILLGSLYQLSLDGTAQYAEDWHWCRRNMLEEVGEVLVLPLLPMPLEGMEDSDTVRSRLEFLLWFEELPDIEARLLADTRAQYKALYLGRIGGGPGWCDGRPSMRMPIRLTSIGKETRASRRLGDRPKNLPEFTIERERYWAEYMVGDLNRTFNLDLATDLAMYRDAAELAGARKEEKTKFVIAGASKTVHLLNPLEVLNVADSVTDIESVMLDQVHLLSVCYEMLADEAVRIVEGWKAGKRFPDESGHQDSKRFKLGPRAGGGGAKKGGGKKSGGRTKQPGNKSGSYSGYSGPKKW